MFGLGGLLQKGAALIEHETLDLLVQQQHRQVANRRDEVGAEK